MSPQISDEQWAELQPRITELFRQGVPLQSKDGARQTISETLRQEFPFAPTQAQLEARLRKWDMAKNLKLCEWKTVIPQLDELESSGIDYQLRLAGQEVKKSAIARARRQLKAKSSMGDPQQGDNSKAKRKSHVRQISIMVRGLGGQWVPYPSMEAAMSPGRSLALAQEGDLDMQGWEMDATGPSLPPAPAPTNLVPFSPNLDPAAHLSLDPALAESMPTAISNAPGIGGRISPLSDAGHPLTLSNVDRFSFLNDIGDAAPGWELLLPAVNSPNPRNSGGSTSPVFGPLMSFTNTTSKPISWFSNLLLSSSHSFIRSIFSFRSHTSNPLVRQPQLPFEVEMILDPLLSVLPERAAQRLLDSGTGGLDTASRIREIILHSLTNNFAGMSSSTLGSFVAAIREDSRMMLDFSQSMLKNTSISARPFAHSLFKVAILSSNTKLAKQIVAAGRMQGYDIRPDEISCEVEGEDYTAIEFASIIGDTEMVNLLLHLGADVNKSCRGRRVDVPGALMLALSRHSYLYRLARDQYTAESEHSAAQPESAQDDEDPSQDQQGSRLLPLERSDTKLVQALLDHGAEVHELHFDAALKRTEPDIEVVRLLLNRTQSRNSELLDTVIRLRWPHPELLHTLLEYASHRLCCELTTSGRDFPSTVAENWDNQDAAAAIEALLELCARNGCGTCIRDFWKKSAWALVAAARRANMQLFKVLLDHSGVVTTQVLSAAIQGQDAAIISLCLQQQLNLREPACKISYKDFPEGTLPTTPLAEAILIRNHQLVATLENRGAFDLVRDLDCHLVAAATAAARVCAVGYLERILTQRPHFEPTLLSPALIAAAMSDSTEAALLLLDSGVAESCQINRMSALYVALERKNKSLIYAILDSDPSFEAYSVYSSVLSASVMYGDYSLVETLIHMGASIGGEDGGRALDEAVKLRRTDLVSLLLAKGAPFYSDGGCSLLDNPLSEAILLEDEEMVQLLLLNGANPAIGVRGFPYRSEDSTTIAYSPSLDGPIFHMLLKAFKTRYPQGLQGLSSHLVLQAVKVNNLKALESLLAAGLNLSYIDHSTRGPELYSILGYAIRESADPSILECLIGAGADVNGIAALPNGLGSWDSGDVWPRQPALLVAIEMRTEALVTFLLDKGANVNCPAKLGVKRTPLQAACEIGSWCMVELLLERGADVNAAPARRGGATALQLAAMGGYVRIAELLLSRGANVHAAGSRVHGRTALQVAAENGRFDMLQLLWDSQQGAGFPDDEIKRAINYANDRGHRSCAETISLLRTKKLLAGNMPLQASGGLLT
ncbi:hypothetical protein MAPG_09970 [Magnaporthiopsis poae ATCC 64411]|uniref:Clr5 domain-containing protein n=1 Tax=Magnaporthiopsis poae (strain ATCC 64411 / 73-15) TaxID=644358 RepID=A0A0C4EBC2_MAGP6|nr:hypothetical protein MAPG_09970 [Magnaporthiopsis poae ATCC 64411]